MVVPRLGDAAAGIRWVIRLQPSGVIVQQIKMVVVAHHGVLAEVYMSGPTDPHRQELTATAARAVAKLQRIR